MHSDLFRSYHFSCRIILMLRRHLNAHRLACFHIATRSIKATCTSLSLEDWKQEAQNHIDMMDNLLYPSSNAKSRFQPKKTIASTSKKKTVRTHLVSDNPIYNFLHSYYHYSTQDLKKYSPGIHVKLNGAYAGENTHILDEKYMDFDEGGGMYDIAQSQIMVNGKYGLDRLKKDCAVLRATSNKTPFFGCFGLHEWAMLYSGNGSAVKRHQDTTPLRVDQHTIDYVVSVPGQLRCTHYDAYRFFQPSAKPMNAISSLTRETTHRYEQPGCIHANMDLFRYAYQLYPFVSSSLLRQALQVALQARKVDMRASPYDVSAFEGCETPICVETPQGRKLYIEEQERVAGAAAPVRAAILKVYDEVLGNLNK